MQKTILLVFVHGFKGDDTTFQNFPSHLRALLSHALPQVNIKTVVYPQFSTTGELAPCVASFRDWLTNQVIDLEVERGTPSPTVDPGVRVILVGHSMGGIVSAEAVLGIVGEDSIDPSTIPEKEQAPAPQSEDIADENPNAKENDELAESDFKSVEIEKSTLMFPHIQGLLAFDTPYLGIAPGVVAHGAEKHWNSAKPWFESAAGLFAGGAAAKGISEATTSKEAPEPPPKSPPPASETPASPTSNETDSSKPPTTPDAQQQQQQPKKSWARWSRTAIYASAGAAAAAAAGTAAYLKRGEISSLGSSSINWVSSHLQFVGCLARGEELRKRIEAVSNLKDGYGVGFATMYTILGKSAGAVSAEEGKEAGEGAVTQGPDRTFCNLPEDSSELKDLFYRARNDKAGDEVTAHMYMFAPKDNPGFYEMADKAKELIVSWVDERWAEPDPES